MDLCVVYCVLFAIFCAVAADTAATTSHQFNPHTADHLTLKSARPVREGELMMLQDHLKQADTLLKERLVESSSNLKQLLKEGDAQLKEQLMEGLDQEKEQRKEGDGRLKEQLAEEATWLKEKLNNGEARMKEELDEEKARMTEKLTDQNELMNSLRLNVKEWKKTRQARVDELQKQMTALQEEVRRNGNVVQTTKDQLDTSRAELLKQIQASEVMVTQLKAAGTEIQSLKVKVRSLETAQSEASGIMDDSLDYSSIGSTFIRWGRKTCPANTSLVYSGVAGGSYYKHTGGASNYLCLVMDTKLDNTTLPGSYAYLHGVEYENIQGHHDQDVVCSVCRASQATTIMIPGTYSCPQGWEVQYKGQLVTDHFSHKRGTEYVCLDEVRENRHGGHAGQDGALFYYVRTACGSLPCPPYIDNKAVACAVCSV